MRNGFNCLRHIRYIVYGVSVIGWLNEFDMH
jgi:hypothetical protein